MGRGRAKAKQTKVARQLKYNSGGTDLDRLAEELGVVSSRKPDEDVHDDEELEDEDDPYGAYLGGEDDDEDDDDRSNGSRGRRR